MSLLYRNGNVGHEYRILCSHEWVAAQSSGSR